MEIVTSGALPPIPEIQDDVSPSKIVIAVDLGTTTIAVCAVQVCSRSILCVSSEVNAQRKFGADVMSRIERAILGDFEKIRDCVRAQIAKLCSRVLLCASAKLPRAFRPQIERICITGNTAMLSFVRGFDVSSLAKLPFSSPSRFDDSIFWGDLFKNDLTIPPQTIVDFPPIVGAFVGADTICAMIAAEFSLDCTFPRLLADLGTNSELALFLPATKDSTSKIVCTSCAAGPAFEAANISCGMAGENGAVDFVRVENSKIVPNVIGGGQARGVCGSGLISAVSAFLQTKQISADGEILGADFVKIAENVALLQMDVRALQLAKSAVRTGIDFLLKKTPTFPEFLIAGGFGTRLDFESAKKISLFPQNALPRSLGNAALFGACALALSKTLRSRATSLSRHSIFVNLAAVPNFQNDFVKNCNF